MSAEQAGAGTMGMGAFAGLLAALVAGGVAVAVVGSRGRADQASPPPAVAKAVETVAPAPPIDVEVSADPGQPTEPTEVVGGCQVEVQLAEPSGDDSGEPQEPFTVLIVLDAHGDPVLSLEPDRLERLVRGYHRAPERHEFWLDLSDGRRLALEPEAARRLEELLPTRYKYGDIRAGDGS